MGMWALTTKMSRTKNDIGSSSQIWQYGFVATYTKDTIQCYCVQSIALQTKLAHILIGECPPLLLKHVTTEPNTIMLVSHQL